MNQTKKVFLNVYLDNNIGDDLMVKGVLDTFPNNIYYAVSQSKEIEKTYEMYNNLIFVQNVKETKILNDIDVYLTLGGSVFQVLRYRHILSRYKKIREINYAKKMGAKIISIGSNIGPLVPTGSKYIINKELRLNDSIVVRDKFSFNYSKKIIGNKVKFADDIVFEILENNESNKKNDIIGISCYTSINHPELNDDFRRRTSMLIDEIISVNKDVRVKLFAFDTQRENDLEAANSIYDLSNYKENIEIIPYLGNDKDFLSDFSECSTMLAVRFHSAILSEIYGIKYFPIAYQIKMTNYIKDSFGITPMTLSVFNEEGLSYGDFVSGLTNLNDRNELVNGHFTIMREYL